jgi:hypothetical protein
MTEEANHLGLELQVCFGASLFEGATVGALERLLRRDTGGWADNLAIWRDGKRVPVAVNGLAARVEEFVGARGALYEQLRGLYGQDTYERRTGSVELRGSDSGLVLVLGMDDYGFAPSAGRWLWGNTLALQFDGTSIGGQHPVEFVKRIGSRICAELSPWYARAHSFGEWAEKNMSRAGGGLMAVGMDASRYVPGMYWWNFFGDPYCKLIGRERLLSAPAHKLEALDSGVLLLLDARAESWDSPEFRRLERRVVAHLGEEYFFDKHAPQRKTRAPDFGLKSLPRNPRFT